MKRKKKTKRKTIYLILAGLAAVIVLTVFGWRMYTRMLGGRDWNLEEEPETYERYYVLITDDSSSVMWQDIYESAKETAKENGAYLETLGEWPGEEYSVADYIRIATAEKADGIIVKPDGSVAVRSAIEEAEQAGIPVITVLEDDTDSSRRSFVGVNSYQLGNTYGEQILRCVTPETSRVMVLLNRKDAGKDLVFKQLRSDTQEGLGGMEVEITSMTLDSGSPFDAEEAIRDLFHDSQARPDVLVCMNETDSECAYFAMVDYNQVGTVQIIGYYQSELMLNAVEKGIIPVVISIDTDQVGRYAVEALEEFYQMGHVSSYYSVGLNVVTKENVQEFLPKQDAEDTE